MEYLKNTVYLFVPFLFDRQTEFNTLISVLDSSESWRLVRDRNLYMLKYVADKIDSNNRQSCQCFHYRLDDAKREQFGLAAASDWFSTKPLPFGGQFEPIRFQILSVQLYLFKTTVGILAFRIHFEKDDPFWVANAEFFLKKVSHEKIGLGGSAPSTTMLSISEKLAEELKQHTAVEFFYYANPSTERANVLTYLEVEPKESYKEELFYLRHCYSDGYLFTENDTLDAEEIYSASKDTVWGISPEAAVCLACPGFGRGGFLQGTFYRNFNTHYLFMYILLLHQKYVLYMFLTKLGVGVYNSLETLEDYRRQLYEFETDFVFSCVTEVPQYQNLYERMTQAFSLKTLYEDVHEPLLSLRDVRRETAEKEQEKRDIKVNRALLLLSLLSLFSALVDSFDFVASFFGLFLGGVGVRIVQGCCIVGIFIMLIFVVKNLHDAKK